MAIFCLKIGAPKQLQRKLDKKTISYGQADNLVIAIAEKYDAFDNSEDKEIGNIEMDFYISPEIVITETFMD